MRYLSEARSSVPIFPLRRILSGVETSLGFGLDCFGKLEDRKIGWALNSWPSRIIRLRADAWGVNAMAGRLTLPGSRTEAVIFFCGILMQMNDELGFSNFFKNGAKRRESLNSAILSYSIPLQKVANGLRLPSAHITRQRNTISFSVEGTSAEMGLSLDF